MSELKSIEDLFHGRHFRGETGMAIVRRMADAWNAGN